MSENNKEMVNHPDHYKGKKFEVIDIIEDYNLNFCLGNAIKYILRAGKKGNKSEDLKKAIWYIEREIKNAETKENSLGNLYDNEKSFTKCMSCGKIFIANNGNMICNECKEKYVGDKND